MTLYRIAFKLRRHLHSSAKRQRKLSQARSLQITIQRQTTTIKLHCIEEQNVFRENMNWNELSTCETEIIHSIQITRGQVPCQLELMNLKEIRSVFTCLFLLNLTDILQNVFDWDRYTIVGTSQEIFKDYLRLTSEPKPETIRPYPVLQRTLTELKKRWKNKESFGTSYNWICNQLKSLRQDLTVCRIRFYLVFSN